MNNDEFVEALIEKVAENLYLADNAVSEGISDAAKSMGFSDAAISKGITDAFILLYEEKSGFRPCVFEAIEHGTKLAMMELGAKK
jgi:hypothetical protein